MNLQMTTPESFGAEIASVGPLVEGMRLRDPGLWAIVGLEFHLGDSVATPKSFASSSSSTSTKLKSSTSITGQDGCRVQNSSLGFLVRGFGVLDLIFEV